MRPIVADILSIIEGIAPPELAEDWDNGGLLAGHPDVPVTGVLTALDVTPAVIAEAMALGMNMIVSHHPLFFHPIRTMREDTPEGAIASLLIRNGIALYSAHTALDKAQGGLNDALAAQLSLSPTGGGPYYRISPYNGDCGTLLRHAQKTLNAPDARLYGSQDTPADCVATACGAGMDFWRDAHADGAKVFITGDVKHHDALDALAFGLTIIDAGHAATERLAAALLADSLQKTLDVVQYTVRVKASRLDAYTGKPY